MRVFCEYIENPIGIDSVKPRFSWRMEENEGKEQKSYRIIVSKGKDLSKEDAYMWDSGEVVSHQTANIVYDGKDLESVTSYYYQVTATDTKDRSKTSQVQEMVTGLIDKTLWQSSWLGIPGMGQEAPMCRTELKIDQDFQKAYAFVVTPNYYVLTINGERATDTVLNNANTDWNKTLPYLMMDVTDLVKKGDNTVGVHLGKGWIGLNMTVAKEDLPVFFLSMQMLLVNAQGEKTWFRPGIGVWEYTQKGPVVYDSIYHGETYDARKEIPHWNMPDHKEYDKKEIWARMTEAEPKKGEICAQLLEPIRVVDRFKPAAVYHLEDGSYTFDMGKNIAGWVRLKIAGTTGQTIEMSFAEEAFPDHSVNKLSIRDAKAIDTYILKGEGTEIYEPDFTFHGFRYVNVKGLTEEPAEDTITGCLVISDIKKTSTFQCSEDLLNRLYEVASRTEETNRHSIPTDCPQRDERLGWTNDMSVRNECALYNYDLVKLYTKWMRDIRDTQGVVSGALSDTAPLRRYGPTPMDPIAITPANLPWNVYCFYGDKRILEENYDMNVRWLKYLERNSEDGVVFSSHMGDWAGPMCGTHAADGEGVGGGAVSTITPTILVATASVSYMYGLMAKIAEVVGKEKDADTFGKKAEEIRQSFLRHFYNKEEKYCGKNSQGANAIALYTEMIPEEDRAAVLENMVKDIVEKNDYHLTTGNLCSRYILEVLFQNGYKDVAYAILTQTTYPSWGFMLERGATTIWERWEEVNDPNSILADMASRNHPMYGAFSICFHKYLAGILVDEKHPAFRNVKIRPYIPENLDFVNASMDTISGVVKSCWKKEGSTLVFDVEIPYNCKGEIALPVADPVTTEIRLRDVIIYKNGSSADSKEVQYLRMEKDRVVYAVTAGIYRFVVSR